MGPNTGLIRLPGTILWNNIVENNTDIRKDDIQTAIDQWEDLMFYEHTCKNQTLKFLTEDDKGTVDRFEASATEISEKANKIRQKYGSEECKGSRRDACKMKDWEKELEEEARFANLQAAKIWPAGAALLKVCLHK